MLRNALPPRPSILGASLALAVATVVAAAGCGISHVGTGLVDAVGDGTVPPTAGEGGTTGADGAAIGADAASSGTDGGGTTGGSSPTRLPCGTGACNIPVESCCVTRASGVYTYSCTAGPCPPTTNGNTTALKCSSAATCAAGTVCCIVQVDPVTASACKLKCSDAEAQLCDPKAVPTGCAAGVDCSSDNIWDWNLPSTYATCGGKGN